MLLLLDHRDSFTFNLVQALAALGAEVRVASAERVSAGEVLSAGADRIVLGPGPGPPERACLARELARTSPVPVLGVCLGHQAIAAAYGARVVRGGRPIHGHATEIEHTGEGLFAGAARPLRVGRYHSLAVDPESVPGDSLEVIARDGSGGVQALRHRTRPIFGLQFHPESVLTEGGAVLLENFLRVPPP